jgi:hypothetical protein
MDLHFLITFQQSRSGPKFVVEADKRNFGDQKGMDQKALGTNVASIETAF